MRCSVSGESKKRGLSILLENQLDATSPLSDQGLEAVQDGASEVVKATSSEVQKKRSREGQKSSRSEVQSSLPSEVRQRRSKEVQNITSSEVQNQQHFADLEPKTVRFRPDQLEALAVLTQRVKRGQKRNRGEPGRITDNTLIRVALDYLLAHADRLEGMTEEQLTKSLNQDINK
jgi:site-specific DNA-cytosine methylase